MPVTPTYPGVYIEELPSGVRTITGVSTSVAAFVGEAKRGPINRAVHILSYADFERRFGGLSSESEMSYAVRQFFLNGGTDAWVIRLAKNAAAAFKVFQNQDGDDVLRITALDEGESGNAVTVAVSHAAANPASNFNLTLASNPPGDPSAGLVEVFSDLSMNSKDPRWIGDVVNGSSQLVKVERVHDLSGLGAGTSTSGEIADVGAPGVLDATHNRFLVSVNGLDPVPVEITLPGDVSGADAAARLATLCGRIQDKVRAQGNGKAALTGFKCEPNDDDDRIVMTSGEGGEASSVRVLPSPANDASLRLQLGAAGGGAEADATAAIRPRGVPDAGALASAALTNADLGGTPPAPATIPGNNDRRFRIAIDGAVPQDITLAPAPAEGADLAARLTDIAERIQDAVQLIVPEKPATKLFTVKVEGGNKLVLRSGTQGAGSSVQVSAVPGDTFVSRLKLTGAGSSETPGKNENLEGGSELPLGPDVAPYLGNRAQRKGLYALEGVDLFNLLCLPGVTDSGVLAEADSYCRERRAFLIVDAPPASKDPAAMVTTISGTALPKSDYAAVYYPWTRIADPLKTGKLRTTAPCGTIAGLYARTDASRGVWKAPAGTEATLTGVLAVEHNLTDRENGTLNPLGVNCIRVLPVFGAVAWGARTLRGADSMASEWKYIPVRRLALYIEESLYRGTQWVVFEPNDEPLWAQIRLNVGAFMNTLFRQGAFQGKTPREAYLVKCDKETTTQDDINRGIVNILVGFAPLKPAEFVIIKIQQLAGQVQT